MTDVTTDADVLVLGAGLAGLAAGSALGERAVVFEREDRVGGLVRTTRFGDYWFDHVVHLLYFPDADTQRRVLGLAEHFIEPCPPAALLDFDAFTVPFPLQNNLWALPLERRLECLRDFVSAALAREQGQVYTRNYAEQLEHAFGRAICDLFLFPYNEKMWRRSLSSMATGGFYWNMSQPSLELMLRGAIEPRTTEAYNAQGWYPRPPLHHPVRGMEVLARSVAANVPRLRLSETVRSIDLDRRELTVESSDGVRVWRWNEHCLSSLPLPTLIRMCANVPDGLRQSVDRLPFNRVRSVAFSIEGPRPPNRGHWRYYASRDLCFTRLIHMCEFDPAMAPEHGWSILAEVPERGDQPRASTDALIRQASRDLATARAVPPDCRIVDVNVIEVDTAYVVFTEDCQAIVKEAHAFLQDYGIVPIGRYGRWEYSSMAQVLRDAWSTADRVSLSTTRAFS